MNQLRRLVLSTYGDICVHCGEPGARSVEHLQPRSRGGTDALANLRPAHLVCNISRGVRPMPTAPVTVETSSNW